MAWIGCDEAMQYMKQWESERQCLHGQWALTGHPRINHCTTGVHAIAVAALSVAAWQCENSSCRKRPVSARNA